MTQEEFDKLEPRKTMVYPKSEGKCVRYMYMGKNEDETHQLYGKPFGHSEYVIKECFEIYFQ